MKRLFIVAATMQTGKGSWLEVVEHRLDSRELPDQVIPSRGRFLAIASVPLDPATYKPGALVSMMGEVTGKEVRQLRERTTPIRSFPSGRSTLSTAGDTPRI